MLISLFAHEAQAASWKTVDGRLRTQWASEVSLRMFSLSILGRRWPSFWQIFSETAWHAGQSMLLSEKIAERTYQRIDRRERLPVRNFDTSLPPRYNYRIPGVAMEFWPVDEDNPGGCENYGWGATLPALILRNIIGFREAGGRDVFLLAPALPRTACSPGHSYGGRAT